MLSDQSIPGDIEHQGEITFLMTQKQEVVTQRHLRRGGLHTCDDIASSFYECGGMQVEKGGGRKQRDRRAGLLRVLAHILTSPAPIPALLTQGQRLRSFLSFTLRLWLREANKAHSEPFRPKTELDLQRSTLKLTEDTRLVLGILLPVSKRNYDLKLFTPHQAPCPTSSLRGWGATRSSSQQHGKREHGRTQECADFTKTGRFGG